MSASARNGSGRAWARGGQEREGALSVRKLPPRSPESPAADHDSHDMGSHDELHQSVEADEDEAALARLWVDVGRSHAPAVPRIRAHAVLAARGHVSNEELAPRRLDPEEVHRARRAVGEGEED